MRNDAPSSSHSLYAMCRTDPEHFFVDHYGQRESLAISSAHEHQRIFQRGRYLLRWFVASLYGDLPKKIGS